MFLPYRCDIDYRLVEDFTCISHFLYEVTLSHFPMCCRIKVYYFLFKVKISVYLCSLSTLPTTHTIKTLFSVCALIINKQMLHMCPL